MLHSGVNWAKLKAEGRCKEIGVPWNEKELEAIYKLKIPAEYVRKGILDKDEYEETTLKIKGDDELLKEAKEKGSTATHDAPTFVLENEIKDKVIEDLIAINGIARTTAEKLYSIGIKGVSDLQTRIDDDDVKALVKVQYKKIKSYFDK